MNPIQREIELRQFRAVLGNFLGSKNLNVKVFIFFILLVILSAWIPELVSVVFKSVADWIFGNLLWWKLLLVILILTYFFCMLRRIRKTTGDISVNISRKKNGRVLALLLSTFSKNKQDLELFMENVRKCEGKELESGITELEKLINESNWKMPLLAIRNHPELNIVYVISSADDNGGQSPISGSFRQFLLFKEVMELLVRKTVIIKELTPEGIDFEDVEKTFKIINFFYDQEAVKKYKKNEIFVDVTGGKKNTSIAAAMATLANGRSFQYVSTTDYEISSFDVVYLSPEEEGNNTGV